MLIAIAQPGGTFDFNALNASGQVWNGSAFVTRVWNDTASYRLAPDSASGDTYILNTPPAGTARFQLRVRGTVTAGNANATATANYVVWEEAIVATQASVDNVASAVDGVQDTLDAIEPIDAQDIQIDGEGYVLVRNEDGDKVATDAALSAVATSASTAATQSTQANTKATTIQAKTDTLPADPASQSEVETAIDGIPGATTPPAITVEMTEISGT